MILSAISFSQAWGQPVQYIFNVLQPFNGWSQWLLAFHGSHQGDGAQRHHWAVHQGSQHRRDEDRPLGAVVAQQAAHGNLPMPRGASFRPGTSTRKKSWSHMEPGMIYHDQKSRT